jgi:fatty acid desaturase
MTCQGNTPMLETIKSAQNEHKGKVPLNDWAAVQCQTSVNWSPGSWFWNHVSGGLSHQIEHHLFPSICHTNYVHIQDVVESTCKEYGVPYQAERNLFTAYGKMLKHLKQMGRP